MGPHLTFVADNLANKKTAIGRALMGAPKLLLLDEPRHGLEPKIVQELHDALVQIHPELRRTTVGAWVRRVVQPSEVSRRCSRL